MTYIFIFLLLLALELTYFKIADKYNIIDKPNERSSHANVTLRGGGVVFYLGMLTYFVLSKFEYPYFFAGITIISVISLADDIKQQSPKLRLIIQFAALFLVFFQWQILDFPWYISIVALIVCAGILNAFNFMDGINGITGAYSTAVIASFWYVNTYIVEFVDNKLIYFALLSLLVFNIFNFRKKAKCFAGDIGAISMAFMVVFLLGMLILKSQDFSYIALLLVYGVDSVLTIIHRMMLKENITHPHRKHLYQLLANELNISQLVVASLYALLQIVIFAGFIGFKQHSLLYLIGVSILLAAVYILLIQKYFHLHQSKSSLNS